MSSRPLLLSDQEILKFQEMRREDRKRSINSTAAMYRNELIEGYNQARKDFGVDQDVIELGMTYHLYRHEALEPAIRGFEQVLDGEYTVSGWQFNDKFRGSPDPKMGVDITLVRRGYTPPDRWRAFGAMLGLFD